MSKRPTHPPEPRHYTNTYELIGRGISVWAVMEIRLVEIFAILLGADERKAGLVLYFDKQYTLLGFYY